MSFAKILVLNEKVADGSSLLVTMAFPLALEKIGWMTYTINGAWDLLQIGMIAYFWVETKGKTMEEIDAIFDGEKHSGVPDVGDVVSGKVNVDLHTLMEL